MKTKWLIIGLIGIVVILLGIILFQNINTESEVQTYEPDKYFCYNEVGNQKGYWREDTQSEDTCLDECASHCTKIGYRYENSEIIPDQASTSNCGNQYNDYEIFNACSCFCN